MSGTGNDRGEDQTRDRSNTIKDPADWTTGEEPMTGAQQSYLRTLASEAKEELPEELTKAAASRRIDEIQHRTGRGLENSQEQGPRTRWARARMADPAFGRVCGAYSTAVALPSYS